MVLHTSGTYHDGGASSEHSHEEEAKEADFTAPPSADQPLVPTATVEAPAAEELPAAEEPEPPAEPETIAEAIGKRPSRIQELQAELATKNQTIFEQDQELGELRVQIQFYRDQESPESVREGGHPERTYAGNPRLHVPRQRVEARCRRRATVSLD